jgi:cellulose biosynthesis protein BcsQ
VGDAVIAPLNVGIYDLWALEDLENVVQEINATRDRPLVCRAVLNCADPVIDSADNVDCRKYAKESELFTRVFRAQIVDRKPIGKASACGLAMNEYRPLTPSVKKGAAEIDAFVNELLKVEL